jgi:hypothetical protein
MRRYLGIGLVLALFAFTAFAADDIVTGVVGTVRIVDGATKTVVIRTKEGADHTIKFIDHTVVHGATATADGSKDAFASMREGDEVVVHYTLKGANKTAVEVDHVGKDGLKASVGAVKSVDRGAKTITVKTGDGAEETYHLTATAMKDTAKGLDKASKVTVYYTEDAGKKVAHFFKSS